MALLQQGGTHRGPAIHSDLPWLNSRYQQKTIHLFDNVAPPPPAQGAQKATTRVEYGLHIRSETRKTPNWLLESGS